MAYVDQSTAFGYGTQLTSTQMQNLRDNLDATMAKESGAPVLANGYVVEDMLASSAVAQGKLKTSTIELSRVTSGSETFESAGYGYCFLGQTYCDSSATILGNVQFDTPDLGNLDITPSVKVTINVSVQGDTGKATHCDLIYITSSGEVFWIFLKRNKLTKEIVSCYCRPDHPCFQKTLTTEHPFYKIDFNSYDIVVINPSDAELIEIEKLRSLDNFGRPTRSMSDVIINEYDIVDDENIKWPIIPITVGIHVKTKEIIKKKIPKPNYIKMAKLVKK